jgi:hypothetical protein
VNRRDIIGFDIEIDGLTNSIKNVISGDSFSTDISRITKTDLKKISQKEGCSLTGNLNSNILRETSINLQSLIISQ